MEFKKWHFGCLVALGLVLSLQCMWLLQIQMQGALEATAHDEAEVGDADALGAAAHAEAEVGDAEALGAAAHAEAEVGDAEVGDAEVGEERQEVFHRGTVIGGCPLGTFYESATQACVACPTNTFKNTSDLDTLCTPCPANSKNSLQTGSKSASDCAIITVIMPIRIDVCGIKPVTLVNMDPVYEAHNIATCDPNPESEWVVECFGESPCGDIDVGRWLGKRFERIPPQEFCAADWGVAVKGKRVECAESRGKRQRVMEPWSFEKIPSVLIPKEQSKRPDEVQRPYPKDTPKSVVLTCWLTYSKDPQRGHQVSAQTIDYIYNLHTTATHLKISVVVFHDSVPERVVNANSNQWVTFKRVAPSPLMEGKRVRREYSTNDYRLKLYNEYVQEHDLRSVLMVDSSDTWFHANPFEHMHRHEQDRTVFIGPDTFTERDGRQRVQHFDQDSWMVKGCFGDQSLEWDQNKTMYNAGVWGGRADVVRCLLVCVSQLLGGPLRGKGNCNMPALNWCISHGPCSVDPAIDPTAAPPPASSMSPPSIATTLEFLNPWREDCLKEHVVVHNKCRNTEGRLCVEIVGGKVKVLETGSGTSREQVKCAAFMKRQWAMRKQQQQEAKRVALPSTDLKQATDPTAQQPQPTKQQIAMR